MTVTISTRFDLKFFRVLSKKKDTPECFIVSFFHQKS